jgi:hypothetical protein
MMLDRPKLCIVRSRINGRRRQMGVASRFCSDAQGIEACEESHPRSNNLELELVYVIRAPGAGDEPAPNSSLDRIYTLLSHRLSSY